MRAKGHPQEVAPYLTQHSADPEWPLVVLADDRGRSYHACADCHAEIPDGVRVERVDGRVVAHVVEGAERNDDGEIEHKLRAVHECEARRG